MLSFIKSLDVFSRCPAVGTIFKNLVGFWPLEALGRLAAGYSQRVRLLIAFLVESFDLTYAAKGTFEFSLSFAGKSGHIYQSSQISK
jgi:hypothetical protein